MGDWSCDGSNVRGGDSREEATDLIWGSIKESFLEEVALKPRQRISKSLAGGRRDRKLFQHMQTARGNRELATLGKLKIALCGWSFGLEVEELR